VDSANVVTRAEVPWVTPRVDELSFGIDRGFQVPVPDRVRRDEINGTA